jgi:hypothetical protein
MVDQESHPIPQLTAVCDVQAVIPGGDFNICGLFLKNPREYQVSAWCDQIAQTGVEQADQHSSQDVRQDQGGLAQSKTPCPNFGHRARPDLQMVGNAVKSGIFTCGDERLGVDIHSQSPFRSQLESSNRKNPRTAADIDHVGQVANSSCDVFYDF